MICPRSHNRWQGLLLLDLVVDLESGELSSNMDVTFISFITVGELFHL